MGDSDSRDTIDGNSGDDFYSADLRAEALAENDQDDDLLQVEPEIPVTSGEMEIGDLDVNSEAGRGSSATFDEEMAPGGEDNVVDPDARDDAAESP